MAVRKEFLSDLRLFHPLKPFENSYFLPAFSLAEAREVIEAPAARKQVRYEHGLVDDILADLHQPETGAPPAQVQLVCYTLFEEKEPQPRVITRELYQQPRGRGGAGAAGILTSHLSRVLEREMPAGERQVARRVLEALVTAELRRAVRGRESLLQELRPVTPALLDSVLRVLVDSCLLRADEGENDEARYELAHDYLLAEIELDPETQARKAAQELLAQEVAAYRQFGTLLSKDKFDIINSQRAVLQLDGTAAALLQQSADVLEAERQRELERERALAEEQRKRAAEEQRRAEVERERREEAEASAARQRRLTQVAFALLTLALLAGGIAIFLAGRRSGMR